MPTITLGFKAFDPHELLCHFVALHTGLYKREKVDVELLDITFFADTDLPEQVCQASCGAALSSALKGIPQLIPFVATDRPMFWLYSSNKIKDMAGLGGAKIATFPLTAPPHHLANIILAKSGIRVEQDLVLVPARDDVARLGLLANAYVDAAVISSAISPVKIRQAGLHQLCFFGDEIRIPTSGLAVHQAYQEKESSLLQCTVDILRQSLSIIRSDSGAVASVLSKYFDVDEQYKLETAELFCQYYSTDGRTSEEIANNAIKSLCQSLSIAKIPDWRQIYTFSDQAGLPG